MRKLICVLLIAALVFTANETVFAGKTGASYEPGKDVVSPSGESENVTFSGAGESLEVEAYGHHEEGEELNTYIYHDADVTVPAGTGTSGVPKSYDLRDKGRVTTVKNQRNRGFCWAFGAIASFESNLIRKGIAENSIDLSEGHLAYYSGHGKNHYITNQYAGKDTGYLPGDGSNYYVAAATLARRYGSVKEAKMPYRSLSAKRYHYDKLRVKHQYELTNAFIIETDQTTRHYSRSAYRNIKRMIMKYGAVASYVAYPENRKEELARFGTNDPAKMKSYFSSDRIPNHGVTVIGWDDNYSRKKFRNKPAGNGAWLVKNSFGKKVNDKGYFWVSYYSPSMCSFVSFQGRKNKGKKIYQYDGAGVGDDILSADRKVTGVNCFRARKDILVDSLGVWTSEANSKVTVKIYVNKNGEKPTSGRRLCSRTRRMKYAGYHTVDLGRTVGIPRGAKFYVLVRVRTPDGRYDMPFEIKVNRGITVRPAKLTRGQSYIKISGVRWLDMKDLGSGSLYGDTYRLYNANVKAFGIAAGKTAPRIKAEKKVVLKKGGKHKLKVKRIKGNGKLIYSSSNSKIVKVSVKGTIKAEKKGKVKITVRTLPTRKYRSTRKTITVRVK
ncbi:MAG: Ig-like domain-containing protein [Firmicutes bacterium]|nr:Ig-like domain-containing protein [Bacillota bacterium]